MQAGQRYKKFRKNVRSQFDGLVSNNKKKLEKEADTRAKKMTLCGSRRRKRRKEWEKDMQRARERRAGERRTKENQSKRNRNIALEKNNEDQLEKSRQKTEKVSFRHKQPHKQCNFIRLIVRLITGLKLHIRSGYGSHSNNGKGTKRRKLVETMSRGRKSSSERLMKEISQLCRIE